MKRVVIVGGGAAGFFAGSACAEACAAAGRPAEVLVQSRYREAAKPAQVEFCASSPARSLIVRYREPQLRPAPGQVAAVYDSGGSLLAGAVVGHVQ